MEFVGLARPSHPLTRELGEQGRVVVSRVSQAPMHDGGDRMGPCEVFKFAPEISLDPGIWKAHFTTDELESYVKTYSIELCPAIRCPATTPGIITAHEQDSSALPAASLSAYTYKTPPLEALK